MWRMKIDRRSSWQERAGASLMLLATFAGGTAWAGNNVWTNLGPFSGNGAAAIAIDPQNPGSVYVGTTGGVFQSANGGANWQRTASKGLPAGYFANLLLLDPQSPNILYAAAACSRCGIFKSVDSGANWSPVNSGLEDSVIAINSLAIDPRKPGTLYLGTTACFETSGSPGFVPGTENLCYRPGVFKTSDGGASWSGVSSGLWDITTFGTVSALAIDPQNPGTVYAGAFGGVFKTTNGGSSWNPKNTGLPCCASAAALVIDPKNPGTVYTAEYYGIFKTTDGGTNWSSARVAASGNCCQSLAIDPQKPSYCLCGRQRWSDEEYGRRDQLVEHGLALGRYIRSKRAKSKRALFAVDAQNPGTLYAATDSLGVFKSTDGAGSWTAVNSGLSAAGVSSVIMDPRNPGTIYAGATGGLVKTTDGGMSWSAANSGLYSVPGSLAIDPQTTSTLYAAMSGQSGGSGDEDSVMLPARRNLSKAWMGEQALGLNKLGTGIRLLYSVPRDRSAQSQYALRRRTQS